MQNGGMFWDVITAQVKVHGEKKYIKAFSQDSNFLHEDIKAFLDNRSWEKNGNRSYASAHSSGGGVGNQSDEVPF
jgi:hypothetical protein